MSSLPSVADWKKLLKSHPDADETAPLTKAMDDYGKVAGKGEPAQLVTLLEKVIDRAKAVKKKNPKNKELVGFLDDMIGDAQKELTRASKESEEGEDEEGEAGDQLRAQLVRVKKLDPDQARPFVLALGQVGGMVIARRPPITRDHRTTAKEMRKGKGKLLVGRCSGEGGKYIFEFEEQPPGGLTKVIKKAAKTHANMEIRIKVRGGGTEIDDEADTAELTDFGTDPEDQAASPVAPPVPKASPILAELSNLAPALSAAIAAAPERKAPLLKLAAKVKGDAQAGKEADAARAIAALKQALATLQTGAGSRAPTEVRTGAGSRVPAARESWRLAREGVGSGLARLMAALRGRSDPRLHRVAEFGLAGLTGRLQVGLETALIDGARSNWTDPNARAKAAAAATTFARFLQTDPMVALADKNPFGVDVGLRAKLLPALVDLAAALNE
jgi:hypothetical protein